MIARTILASGSLFLTLSPLTAFAAPAQMGEITTNVTVAECRTILAPQSFSTKQAREHQFWHDQHEEQRIDVEAWQLAHTSFHNAAHVTHMTYVRDHVACGKLMRDSTPRRVANVELLVFRPAGRRGFFPIRLTQTGARERAFVAGVQGDVSWRDRRFAGADRPSRRTMVLYTLERQEEQRKY